MIALVAAAGGTAVATSLPSGDSLIKKNSLSGNRLKADTVTGKQIKESSLGTVPAAVKADSATTATSASTAATATTATNATNATNATTVNGRSVTTFSQTVARNGSQAIVTVNGLTLTLACDASGEPTLTGTSATDTAMMRGTVVTSVNGAAQVGTSNTTAGLAVSLVTAPDHRGSLSLQYVAATGKMVSVNAYVDDSRTVGGFDGCSLTGSAIGN
ncbi:MAG: hypothetical protein U0Y82_16570 [Thermoleophilia bacterium]